MIGKIETALGDELLEYLTRGEITGSSFAFYVDWEDDSAQSWETVNGIKYRYIHKIQYIHDVSPVFTPAYSATSVSKRALDKCKELEQEERKLEEAKKDELMSKLDSILDEVDKTNEKFIIK